jgi:5'/3'-nucleotidase SurE
VLPHILLSNDDGIYSNGIRALAQEMPSREWDVTVKAPRLQRSGELLIKKRSMINETRC